MSTHTHTVTKKHRRKVQGHFLQMSHDFQDSFVGNDL